MRMQSLPPDKRKGPNKYIQGSFFLYDDRPSADDPDQMRLKEELRKHPELSEYGLIAKGTCTYCGRSFYQWKKTGSGRVTKYCSARCRNDSYMARRKARHDLLLNKSCSVCGSEFTAKKTDALYCSNACKQKAYRMRHIDL